MASLAQQTDVARWIDLSLDYLTATWAAVPEIAATWESREEIERLDFVMEWPLREDRLRQLRNWDAKGQLSTPQRRRLDELERLIQQLRPTLDRLLAD